MDAHQHYRAAEGALAAVEDGTPDWQWHIGTAQVHAMLATPTADKHAQLSELMAMLVDLKQCRYDGGTHTCLTHPQFSLKPDELCPHHRARGLLGIEPEPPF